MYNRYIRSDDGTYQRVPREEADRQVRHEPPQREPPREEAGRGERKEEKGAAGFLRRMLDKLKLEDVDTGDILLLLLLLFLFSEGEDEELLFALGLLLLL